MRAVFRSSNLTHCTNTGMRARKVKSSAPTQRMPAPAWVLDTVYIDAAGRVVLNRARARNDSRGTPMSRLVIRRPWLSCQWGMGSRPTMGHQNSVAENRKARLTRSITHMWSMAKPRAAVRKKANIET